MKLSVISNCSLIYSSQLLVAWSLFPSIQCAFPSCYGKHTDTLSIAALIVNGETHFDRGPFGLCDLCLKNLHKLISILFWHICFNSRIMCSDE